MEYLNRSIAIANELEREHVMDHAHVSPRLQRCVSEIQPLFDRLKKFRSPWGSNTLGALKKLHEALESTCSLVPSVQDGENSEELVRLMVAIHHLWRRQVEMHLALQLQEVLEQTECRSASASCFPTNALLRSTACSANTPAVHSPSHN